MTMHEPVDPPAPVPDDRVHGDSLPGAGASGDFLAPPER